MRVQRMASHSAAATAGKPAMTESEITTPLEATNLTASVTSADASPLSRKKITTAIWPMNIAPNTTRPQSAVPQNFQTRGGRAAGVTRSGGLAGLRESVKAAFNYLD